MAVRRSMLGLWLVIAACGAPEDAAPRPLGDGGCSAGTAERRPLVLPDGLHGYVEPVNLFRVGESFVVAGSPSYTWEVGGPRVVQRSAAAHIAAYLDADAPRMVEKPIGGHVGVVRTVALDERRWGALFTQPESESDSDLQTLVGLWYAEFDGERWSGVEPVAVPEDSTVRLEAFNSSPLVRFEGGLSWAVTDLSRGTFRFERRRGRWSLEVAEPRGGEATSLAADAAGLWLAVSGLDPAISEPRKSVRLYRWRDGWRLVHRYPTVETYTEILQPALMAAGDGMILTWREEPRSGPVMARARVGITVDDPGADLLLDEGALRAKPVVLPDGSAVWAVEHPNPISIELRLVRAVDGRALPVRTYPYPYTGWYAVTAAGPDAVLVTGSEFDPAPARPTVRSLTLRLPLSCE